MASQDLVGERIKMMRRQRGLSQAQLAHPELSDSYVSLIESGKRTPTLAVLELLAAKLDCSLTYLVNGVTAERMEELEVALRFARLALENGDVAEARQCYGDLIRDKSMAGLATLRAEAEFGYARACEACGDLDEAVETLNQLLVNLEGAPIEQRIPVTLALCRCYRDSGNLSRAVEVGEAIFDGPGRIEWSDELVEMGATLLAAYIFRADLLRAQQFATELLGAAELLGTPRAIVAAHWNAATVAEQCGRGQEAVALAERALAVQSETGDPRNLARLRTEYAWLRLLANPHDAEACRDLLERAHREMSESSTPRIDRVRCLIYLAQAELLLGRAEHVVELLRPLTDATDGPPPHSSELHRILGQAYAQLGRDEDAAFELINASQDLESSPKDRRMAQSWVTMATTMETVADYDDAIVAYQQALACAGF